MYEGVEDSEALVSEMIEEINRSIEEERANYTKVRTV